MVDNIANASQREVGHWVENAVFAVPNLSIIFYELSRSGRVFTWAGSSLVCWMVLFYLERVIHILVKIGHFARTEVLRQCSQGLI